MSTHALSPPDLTRAVGGDLDAFALLSQQPHAAIQECRTALADLVVTAEAVRKVLDAFQRGAAPPEFVQQWASFVRRGYVAGAGRGPIKPIEIDYQRSCEDEIAEVIARLDEIGALIDGVPSDDEVVAMLCSLSAA